MPRRAGLILIAISTVALAAAIPAFVARARAFAAQRSTLHLRKIPMVERSFTAHGRPVSIVDDRLKGPAGEDLGAAVRLTYGDHEPLLVPVHPPPGRDVPDLLIYGEWLAMLRLIPATPEGEPIPGATEADDRYLLVVRDTPEGFDPGSWGAVRRREWTFRFYELMPDGSIAQRRYRWPLKERPSLTAAEAELEGGAEAARRAREQAQAARAARLPESIRDLPELPQRSVEYEAALFVIPKLAVPEYRFKDTAFNWDVAGWTMPVAGAAVLGLLAGLAIAFAPRSPRPPARPIA
jgi:hypothetical protein